MKRTDLVKSLGLKIRGQMQQAPIPSRFGEAAGAALDRREQRKLDQAAGLVPFAVKLHNGLVQRLHALAAQEGVHLNVLAARLIEAGLAADQGPAAGQTAAVAEPVKEMVAKTSAKASTKTAAKKAAGTTAATEATKATKATKKPAPKPPAINKAASKKAASKAAKPRQD